MKSPSKASEKVVTDFRTLASHAQELLSATASFSGENVTAAREKLTESLRDATDQIKEAQEFALEQGKLAAQSADAFVREKPWQSIAGAFIAGLLLGALSGGRR